MAKFKVTFPPSVSQTGEELTQRLKAIGVVQTTESGDLFPPMYFDALAGQPAASLEQVQAVIGEYGGTVEQIDQPE